MGWPVLPCTVGFTVAASGLMAAAAPGEAEGSDAAIGVLWALGMAFGVILLDLTPGYRTDVMSFLFGSILAVSAADLWLMLGVDAALLALALFFYKDFLAISFDREFAAIRGVRVRALRFLLLAMIAAAVVVVIRVVGLVLVIALLSIPTSLARRRSGSLGGIMWRAGVFSAVFCVLGLFAAYALNITSGAAIIAVAGLAWLIARGLAAAGRASAAG